MPAQFTANLATKYSGDGEKVLVVSHYAFNNSPSLQILAPDGAPLLTASVALDYPPEQDCILIKDWSENEGIQAALERLELIGPVISNHPTGYVAATEHRMMGELLNAWHEHIKSFRGEVFG